MLDKSPDLSGLRSLHQVGLVCHQGTAAANGVSTASWALSALAHQDVSFPQSRGAQQRLGKQPPP